MKTKKIALFGLVASTIPLMGMAQSTGPTVDSGTTAWMLTSTVLVLLMVPGLAMFYGGLARTKNVLGTMMHSFAALLIVGVLWPIIGYAMAFGPSIFGGLIGWDANLFLLQGIDEKIIAAGIPEYVYAMFQGKFAIIAPALMAGAIAERVSFRGFCVLVALWSLFVYNPLCHWVWASEGFLFQLGAIDFAGGTVVHISSGVSGLVAAWYVGPRLGYPKTAMHPSHLVMSLVGVGLLWVGWFGFNAGSGVSSNLLTAQALTATQAAAASGGLMWLLIESLLLKKVTSLGIASGMLAGLVAVTPAAGVVQPAGALALGALAALACYWGLTWKNKFRLDDSLDAFGIHGVAGMVGALGLTFLLRPSQQTAFITAAQEKGEVWTIFHQLGVQGLGVVVTIGYCAIMTFVLVVIVQKTVGLRLSETQEKAGMDFSLHGERGYGLINLN